MGPAAAFTFPACSLLSATGRTNQWRPSSGKFVSISLTRRNFASGPLSMKDCHGSSWTNGGIRKHPDRSPWLPRIATACRSRTSPQPAGRARQAQAKARRRTEQPCATSMRCPAGPAHPQASACPRSAEESTAFRATSHTTILSLRAYKRSKANDRFGLEADAPEPAGRVQTQRKVARLGLPRGYPSAERPCAGACPHLRGCRKKRTISAEASGPAGSV